MGLMRFQVCRRDKLAADALERVYFCGIENFPFRTRASWRDGELLVERSESESGNIYVPWKTAADDEVSLGTASLMERSKSYQLEVELARGTINMLRNQLAAWRMAGLAVPAPALEKLVAATQRFAVAATSQQDPPRAADLACEALDLALEAIRLIGACYTTQALAVRRRQNPRMSLLMGANLGGRVPGDAISREFVDTFDTAIVPLSFRQVEPHETRRDWLRSDQQLVWCAARGLRVASGPLIQFDAAGFPDWTYLWEKDFDNLLSFALDHVRAVVERYQGRVHLWQLAGRINTGRALGLTDEQRLRIVIHAIEALRAIDAQTPIVVSFDQPWGEYLARMDGDLAPLHFADTLVRAELGIAGLGLEINLGYHPGGTYPRTILDLSQQLDRWSLLGLPLLISVTAPSGCEPDPRARLPVQSLAAAGTHDRAAEWQREWIERHVPIILSKNCVQVFLWNQLDDGDAHDYPHGGLWDAGGQPKPGLAALQQIKTDHLG